MFAVTPMAAAPDAGDDWWYKEFPGFRSKSGVPVSSQTAMQLTAVYSCVKVISEAVMQLPLILYRRLGKGAEAGRERATDHPLYSLLKDQPNADMTAAEWREVMQHNQLLRGNAYCPIVRDGRRDVRELGVPYAPDTVRIEELGAGRYRYVVRPPTGGSFAVQPADMLHLRALVVNKRMGLNPIEAEREAVGVGVAAQNFAARFFANDAQPPGYLTHPTHFANDEAREAFGDSWHKAQGGSNHGKTGVLEYGVTYTPVRLRLRDAEFLATRKYQNIEICRIFRVPPHLIMELDRATFSNISSQGIEFVKFTLIPWFVRWEQKLAMMLLAPERDLFFEFLVDGLERGDPNTRSTYYGRGIKDGWLLRNEARVKENMDQLPGLSQPLQPLNMAPVGEDGTAARDDELNDARNNEANGVRQNAAANLARKWGHKMEAMTLNECRTFISQEADRVMSFMACSEDDAEFYCMQAVEDMNSETPLDEWMHMQVNRLTQGRI